MTIAQIKLTAPESNALRELSERTGKSEELLLQEAVQQLLVRSNHQDRKALLHQGKGIWKDRDDLPEPRTLRAEWDRLNLHSA